MQDPKNYCFLHKVYCILYLTNEITNVNKNIKEAKINFRGMQMFNISIKINEPKRLIDQIASGLRDSITSGRLKPGEQLKEMEIADLLRVSRSPVREAIRILNLEGLVDLFPRRGARVHLITLEDVKDIYQIREMIEGFVCSLSAENMQEEDIAELEKHWGLMEVHSKNGNLDNYLEASTNFHNKLIASCHNKKLETIYQGLLNWFKLFRSFIHTADIQKTRASSSLLEHRAIIDALKDRNKDLSEKLSREHVQKGRDNLFQVLKLAN